MIARPGRKCNGWEAVVSVGKFKFGVLTHFLMTVHSVREHKNVELQGCTDGQHWVSARPLRHLYATDRPFLSISYRGCFDT